MVTDESANSSQTDSNLKDLDRYYDDPRQVRALMIELNAWDLENDCFLPENLVETEVTATPSHLQPRGHPPDASAQP